MKKVTDEELEEAKQYITGKMSLRMEDSENIATWWASQALYYPTMESRESALKKVLAVTKSQVNNVAKKTFIQQHANLVIVGPYSKSQEHTFKKHLSF